MIEHKMSGIDVYLVVLLYVSANLLSNHTVMNEYTCVFDCIRCLSHIYQLPGYHRLHSPNNIVAVFFCVIIFDLLNHMWECML